MVSGAIAGQNFPRITTEEGKQRLIDAVPDVGFYRTSDGKLSFNPPKMNTINLLADPNIGPQNIVAVPLGGGNTGGERTGLMGPTQQTETPAADYVTQIGMERRKEEIQRGLLGVDQPNGLAGKAADVGADLARDQNTIGSLSGLLGDLDYKGILNQLVKTFQRPEMLTPGVNALTSFGMSGAALNQAEMAGAAAEQARADKLAGAEQVRADKFAIAGINNAPGAPEFDKTQTDLLLDITKGQGALDNLQKALELSLKSKLTGAGPQGIQGVSNLLAAFGIDPGVSDIKNYENRVARIKADLSASRIFGREMNKQELKILEKLVSDPGIFNTNTQLRNQLRSLTGSLEKTIGTKRRIIAAQFPNANIREIIEPPKSVFKE